MTAGPAHAAQDNRAETGETRHIPGEPGLWVMIFGDLVAFSVIFITYIVAFIHNREAFDAAQNTLNLNLGLLNTLILLTSSWCAARCVAAIRSGHRAARQWLVGAMVLGAGFVAVKMFEYAEKIEASITLNSSEFHVFYFMLTGIHLIHVVIGLGVLVFMLTRFQAARWTGGAKLAEGGPVFWHLVDMLWVVIFALVYLI